MSSQYTVVVHAPKREREALHYIGLDEERARERYGQVQDGISVGETVEQRKDGKTVRKYTRTK